ncbi:IS3 family transposase [Streptomyces chartreusis]|uniref:IS3 family transposase n=1 Tax=Streptomyces chartreusis TaxID=1969 RepID=UPI002E18FA82|nr:IS3 family transposase [Streptomyces chartreusis]
MPKQYPKEVRERAVRLVLDHLTEYPSVWEACRAIAPKLDVGAESLRRWVRQAQTDAGERPGVTTDMAEENRRLRAENRELKRANEILRAASGFLRGRARPATEVLVTFIDTHRGRRGEGDVRWGVEPICRVLTEHGFKIAPSTYYAATKRPASARAMRDAELKEKIAKVHADNFGVYGVHKMWRELNRKGIPVARCTVRRLMRALGLAGAVRGGKKIRTTVPDTGHERAVDRLERDFTAMAPNRRWVADFTYVATWAGFVYVAFVVDIFSRTVVGWSVARHKRTDLVLDALKMALWRRDREGHPPEPGLIHHSDAGSQYTAFTFTAHLMAAGLDASIGTVGDAYDNALMESMIGLYKTELIERAGPWRTLVDVEFTTAEWVDWYNNRRLHTKIGDIPPTEHEANYYAEHHHTGE